MEEEVLKKIKEQDEKLAAIYDSVEKIRKYFLWSLVIMVAIVILPLIGLAFVIPEFLSIYTGDLGL
ncbi:MAG: hypothetical protein COU46_02635 [Candidatus Niyogibacteria bacterium CG10_big_fil_rev_8_21_14_0_10_42_19]|uniref:Uncharacterized protein n=1 Tax=Candidatus Niyogibacteria bacterium CG10_big_fil_rev_8_21_14_0_10_42_19 TaxID=1974725 RepID=A0A2H0TF87_9BACT|nr:MAG: hypothetical protein COU46_02635 [Candidatus Niyogibacteria bacterium CG10_big_fil_rev_8_21_14_0_10_42_19]